MLSLIVAMLGIQPAASEDTFVSVQPEGVLIKAHSWDAALEFYTQGIGFSIREDGERWVVFDTNTPVYMTTASEPVTPEQTSIARPSFVLHTTNMEATRARWEVAGVEIIDDTPNTNGVGTDFRFHDSEGNHLSVMQLSNPPEGLSLDGSAVYNYGYSFPDITSQRRLFSEVLGFPVLTEAYFPPALPMASQEGGFGFMLHENADLLHSDVQGPDQAGLVIVFTTPDLDSLSDILEDAGYETGMLDPAKRGGHDGIWIHVGAGVTTEFWHRPAN